MTFETIKAIGIIGVGNMGSAVAQAISENYPDLDLYLADGLHSKAEAMGQTLNAHAVKMENIASEMLTKSNLVFVAVKPKDLEGLFRGLLADIPAQPQFAWVSMAVGVSLEDLHQMLPNNNQIIRIMPNTPIAIGRGFVSYCYDSDIDHAFISDFETLMQAAGQICLIDEDLFDAATAIAGSGPAFIYQLIEAMSDAGVYYGIPRPQALEMAAATVVGAGEMVLASGQHPGVLKDAVTSPQGTTIAGIRELEAQGFRSAIIEAIAATVDRTKREK